MFENFVVWARGSFASPQSRSFGLAEDKPVAQATAESVALLLQGLFDSLQEEVALLDGGGAVLAVNAAWRTSFHGVDADARQSRLGVDYLSECGKISPELQSEDFRRGVRDVIGLRAAAFTHDFVVRSEGATRRRRARITRLTPVGAELFVAIHDSAETQETWISHAQDVFKAQETERQRIAIELHDSTSQHLAALGLGVARLRRLLGSAAEDVLEDMSTSIAEVMKEIRVLSFLKRPIGLQRDSLDANLRTFVKGFGARTELDARLSIEGELNGLPQPVEHAAFRIIQEGLSNVYRHAKATAVEVKLIRTRRTLMVRVADNGQGIAGVRGGDLSQVSMGVGIAGMLTRVGQLGGQLEIKGENEGAVVMALLPLTPPGTARQADLRGLDAWKDHGEQRKDLARLGEEHSTEMAEVLLTAFDTVVAHHHKSSQGDQAGRARPQ